MSRVKWLIGVGLMLAALFLLLIPIKYYRVLSVGTDAYEAHYVLYGDRSQRQNVHVDHDLVGIGAIVVDFRRSNILKPVEVIIRTLAGEEILRGEIEPNNIVDDTFAWALFGDPVNYRGEVVVEFRSPEAHVKNSAGLRFNKENGEVALGLVEKVTVGQRIVIWVQDYPQKAKTTGMVLVGGSLVALFLSLAGIQKKILKLSIVSWLMMGVAIMALVVRVRTAIQVESVFGGDAYNYLIQSRAWLEGGNPFAEEFRRKAPLLPLLLLPAWLGMIDPVMWGRIISMLAATGAVIMLPVLLLRLKVPAQLALGAGILLAVNRSFWWESVHGLANTLYAALILAAVFALAWQRKRVGKYLVGVLAGLVMLTRWEGVVVGAVLLPAVWIRHRFNYRTILYTLWPALILGAIPFVFWPITGEVGIRTVQDIAGDGGLQLAYSWDDFTENIQGFELFLGRNFVLVETVGDQLWWLLAGVGGGIIGGGLYRRRFRSVRLILDLVPYLLLIIFSAALIEGSRETYKYLSLVLTSLVGVGWGALLILRPKWSWPVAVMLLGQIMVITTILPKSRYYLQLIPFLVVGVVMGLLVLGSWRESRISRVGTLLLLGALSVFVYMESARAMPGEVSVYNEKSGDHTVVTQAVLRLLDLPGKVAVVEESDLPARVYLTMKRTRIFPIEWAENMEDVTDAEIYEWFKINEIKYLIETSAQPVFSIIDSNPDDFELLDEYRDRSATEKAKIYRVDIE